MAIALVNSVIYANTTSGTSAAIDTTGATLIVIAAHNNPTITDSKSNTWLPLTDQTSAPEHRLFYAVNPTVGTGHTFSINAWARIVVTAWSGADTVQPFDEQNGTSGGAVSPVQPGSITPSLDGELVVAGASLINQVSNFTVSGYTVINSPQGGGPEGCSLAYAVQTTATATNPLWANNDTNVGSLTIASFMAARTAPSPIAYVTGTTWAGTSGTNTSSALNTTGASLLVICVTDKFSWSNLADSKGNTWTPLTAWTGTAPGLQLYYAANPTVGSGHTFSFDGWSRCAVQAFSGVTTTSPFDQQNGGSGGASDGRPGSITPTQGNELVVCGVSVQGGSGLPYIGGGFSATAQVADAGGVPHGIGLAYRIQNTAVATNPAWATGSAVLSVGIASFKAAAGGTNATPTVAAATFVVPTPTFTLTTTPTPTAVAATFVVPTPAVSTGVTNITATAVAMTAVVGTAQISTVQTIAKISDRGVRNSTGTGNATLTLTNPTLIRVGNYLVARVAVDNSGSSGARPGLTLTDARNGTWTHGTGGLQDPGAASAGSASYLCYVKVAVAYQAADALTFTWTTGTPISAIVVEEWAGIDLTTPLAVAETQANNVSTTAQPSISRTPTAVGQLMYVCASNEGQVGDWGAQDTDTTDGSWVDVTKDTANTGTHDTSMSVYGGYKVVTGTTAQTWNNTLGVTGDWSACAVVFAAQAPSLSIVAVAPTATFVIPTPTVSTPAGTNATPNVAAATFVVPTPTFTMSANPAVTAVAGSFTIPTPAITVTTTPTPAVVAATFVAPTPTFTRTTTPTPTVVASTYVLPTPTFTLTTTPSPTVVAATFVIPTPAVSTAAFTNITATVVAGTFTAPTPTVTASANITTTAPAAAFVVPTPSVTTGSTTAIGATAVAATFTVPTPAIAGTQIATTAPAQTWTIPTPAVSTSSTTNITATAVALVGTVPTPTFTRTTTPTPTAVAMICAAPTPAVTASATILATVVAAIFQIGTSSPLAPSLGGHGFEVVTVQHGVETVTAQHGGETTVAQHGSEVTDT